MPLEPARDYKRLLDGDQGPNTGGMGSYSPVSGLPVGLADDIMRSSIRPSARWRRRGAVSVGFLYVGLALTAEGPKVLEFNVRLGDPETQAILPRMTSDLVDVMEGPAQVDSRCGGQRRAGGGGYPESPIKGASIQGIDAVPDDVLVFHAAPGWRKRLLVDGGRVLDLVGIGSSVSEARDRAYEAVAAMSWPGMQHRTDIAAQS